MRNWRPWLLYALAALLGFGAMGWVTRASLRSERAEAEAQARLALDEKARLALWRMDSTMALFLTPENARPYFHYESFYPPGQAYAKGGAKADPRQLLIPSPMLIGDDPLVRLRFQIAADGTLSSPLIPPADLRALAREACPDPARMEAAARRLDEIRPLARADLIHAAMAAQGDQPLGLDDIRRFRGGSKAGGRLESPYMVYQGGWATFWLEGKLLMARQIWVGDAESLQVCWLEWEGVQELLMSAIRDILPDAKLLPQLPGGAAPDKARVMSSMPLRLEPGPPPPVASAPSPARAALWFGWAFALLGATAGGWALHRTLQLGERRGDFASAVTHELRTPLTTFRLYTELLAKDMVPEEAERRELLQTLLSESARLDHLVKNVLAYARLEGGRPSALEQIRGQELLDRLAGRLKEQAAQGGMTLDLACDAAFAEASLRCDPVVVEQILANLVDNACKYAKRGAIRIQASKEGLAAIRVRDEGPGFAAADLRNLFKPFRKSSQAAARSAPGVGLGLSLCRRLARGQGGDLELEPSESGACFRLSLPLAG